VTGRDGTEAHQLQDKPRGVFISRSDVAHGMLDAVDRAEPRQGGTTRPSWHGVLRQLTLEGSGRMRVSRRRRASGGRGGCLWA